MATRRKLQESKEKPERTGSQELLTQPASSKGTPSASQGFTQEDIRKKEMAELKDFMRQQTQETMKAMEKQSQEFKLFVTQSQAELELKLENSLKQLKMDLTQDFEAKIKAISDKYDDMAKGVDKNFKLQNESLKVLEQGLLDEREETERNRRDDMAMIEMRQKERSLRLRGVPEDSSMDTDDLVILISDALAPIFDWEMVGMEQEIEKIFRIDSRIARERKLPRDVIVYFTRQRVRDKILRYYYQHGLTIRGAEIKVYKEIPTRLLAKRADYDTLVKALRDLGYKYRWEFPEGLTVYWGNQRYKLTSTLKAEDFYRRHVIPELNQRRKNVEKRSERKNDRDQERSPPRLELEAKYLKNGRDQERSPPRLESEVKFLEYRARPQRETRSRRAREEEREINVSKPQQTTGNGTSRSNKSEIMIQLSPGSNNQTRGRQSREIGSQPGSPKAQCREEILPATPPRLLIEGQSILATTEELEQRVEELTEQLNKSGRCET